MNKTKILAFVRLTFLKMGERERQRAGEVNYIVY